MSDFEENKDVPLGWGRSFLAKSHSLIDLKNRHLILMVNGLQIVVDMNKNSESHFNISWYSSVRIYCFDNIDE